MESNMKWISISIGVFLLIVVALTIPIFLSISGFLFGMSPVWALPRGEPALGLKATTKIGYLVILLIYGMIKFYIAKMGVFLIIRKPIKRSTIKGMVFWTLTIIYLLIGVSYGHGPLPPVEDVGKLLYYTFKYRWFIFVITFLHYVIPALLHLNFLNQKILPQK